MFFFLPSGESTKSWNMMHTNWRFFNCYGLIQSLYKIYWSEALPTKLMIKQNNILAPWCKGRWRISCHRTVSRDQKTAASSAKCHHWLLADLSIVTLHTMDMQKNDRLESSRWRHRCGL